MFCSSYFENTNVDLISVITSRIEYYSDRVEDHMIDIPADQADFRVHIYAMIVFSKWSFELA